MVKVINVCKGPLRSTSSPAPHSARDENRQINLCRIVELFRRISRHGKERYRGKQEHQYSDIFLHGFLSGTEGESHFSG